MNEFFDQLGAAAKRAGNKVSIGVNVAAEEQKLREVYQSLGKLCYQAKRAGKAIEGEDFEALYAKADAILKRIDELKEQKDVAGCYAEEEDFVTVE